MVSNPAPDWDSLPRWTIDAEPTWEVGGAGQPDERLAGVSGGVLLPDGRAVVTSYGTSDVRFYDANGQHLRTVAASGVVVTPLGAPLIIGPFGGDSLMVLDAQSRTLVVLTQSGELIRSFAPAAGDTMALPVPIGVLESGRVLVFEGPDYSAGTSTGVRRMPAPFHLAGPDGTILKKVAEFPGGEVSLLVEGQRMTASGVAFSPDFYLSARGDRVAAGNSERLDVHIYDPEGNPVRIIRQERETTPLPPEAFDRAMEEALARQPTPEARAAAEKRYRQMPIHESYPAFSALRLDSGGNLWVEEYKTPAAPGSRWQVFDPEGRLAAYVDMPPGVTLLDIGDQAILGLVRNAQEERVLLYRLDRGP